MKNAIESEIKGLPERETFKVVLREDVLPDGNILPGRFVLAIKSTGDDKKNCKARFVVDRHKDKLKCLMVHTSRTIQPSSIRLLIAVAAMKGFDVWSSEVRQVYLKSYEELSRDMYLKELHPELKLEPHESLQLFREL